MLLVVVGLVALVVAVQLVENWNHLATVNVFISKVSAIVMTDVCNFCYHS